MSRIEFKNLPDQTTPITAENLNKLNNLAIDTSVGEHEEEVVLVKSNNIFTKKGAIIGYYLNNNGTNSNYASDVGQSDYIEIEPNEQYTIRGDNFGNAPAYCFYDSNKTFISGTSYLTAKEKTFTTPSNAKYFKTSLFVNSIDSITLVKGDSNTKVVTPSEIYANGEKYTDTLNIGVEPNNSGLYVEVSKNLFRLPNTQTKNGITYTNNGNGTFNLSGTATANAEFTITYNLSETKLTDGTYTIGCKSKGYTAQINLYTSASAYISTPLYRQYGEDLYSKTGNIPINSNVGKIVFQIFVPKDKTLNLSSETIMLNKGSEALPFEPYIESPSIKVNNNGVYETIVSQPVVLWTNSSPTSAFANQNVTLSTSDYNYYEVLFVEQLNSFNGIISTGKVPKGKGTSLNTITNYASSTPQVFRRAINYTNDTTLAVEVGYYQVLTSSSRSSNNQIVVPYQILGYK